MKLLYWYTICVVNSYILVDPFLAKPMRYLQVCCLGLAPRFATSLNVSFWANLSEKSRGTSSNRFSKKVKVFSYEP
jgi:hypothetical protein